MWLSNAQRARLLVRAAIAEPKYLLRYLSHLPIWKRSPAQIELPWWSYGAIDFVGSQLTRQTEVFEFGTGGSTLFFARRCRYVECVEDDINWQTNVERELGNRGLGNCRITSRSLPQAIHDPRWNEYASTLSKPYDIIVVDQQDPVRFGQTGGLRSHAFYLSEAYIKPGGCIVVDDSWRYTDLRTRSKAGSVRTFQGLGPCRLGVTSTDVYCY